MQQSQLLLQARDEYLEKITIYLSRLNTQPDPIIKKKIVALAGTYILRQKDIDREFLLTRVYQKIRQYIQKTANYWGLELLDYLLKNSKTILTQSQSNIEELFLLVYKDSTQKRNNDNIVQLRLIWKTWTYIFQNKYLKNIQPKVKSLYNQDIEDIPIHLVSEVKKFVSQIEPEYKRSTLEDTLLSSDSN